MCQDQSSNVIRVRYLQRKLAEAVVPRKEGTIEFTAKGRVGADSIPHPRQRIWLKSDTELALRAARGVLSYHLQRQLADGECAQLKLWLQLNLS